MIDRIKNSLQAAMHTGMIDDHDKDLGLDSLILSLWVLELQREFSINIPALSLQKQHFTSINSVANYLTSLEAS